MFADLNQVLNMVSYTHDFKDGEPRFKKQPTRQDETIVRQVYESAAQIAEQTKMN